MEFNLILHGINEFNPIIKNNKLYNILVINNLETETYMISIFENFLNNKNKKYIGIDFEFNHVSKEKNELGLMQINLETNDNYGHIFLLHPNNLLDENYNKLIILITDENTYKILHGAESLDITYLFNQLLITKSNINKFCINFYDTKYLCEYYKIENNLDNKTSCGIYNLLLLFNVITKKQLKKLEKIETKMGHIWLIKIDVNELTQTLSLPLLCYALYDVLYLPELLKLFLNQTNNIYYEYIIPEITTLIYKYKKNVENQFLHLEKLINNININFIYINNKKYSLQEIWEIYYNFMFSHIKEINYFKQFFKIISKFVIYHNIYKFNKIYYQKNTQINQINFNFFSNWLLRYKYINNIILSHTKFIELEITNY